MGILDEYKAQLEKDKKNIKEETIDDRAKRIFGNNQFIRGKL